MICEKHGCVKNEWVECPGCVYDERDRLRNELLDEQANAESWRRQHENRVEDVLRISKELDGMREERDRLREKLEEAKRLLCAAITHGGSYFTVPYGAEARKVVES